MVETIILLSTYGIEMEKMNKMMVDTKTTLNVENVLYDLDIAKIIRINNINERRKRTLLGVITIFFNPIRSTLLYSQ